VDGLGNADDRDAALAELVADRERAVAADHHQRVETHLVEHLDDTLAVLLRAVGRLDDEVERIAGVDCAENGAAAPQDPRDVARREDARAIEFEQAVVAVLEPETADAAVPGALDDCTDDCVEAGSVAAAREDPDAFDRCHGGTTITKGKVVDGRRLELPTSALRT